MVPTSRFVLVSLFEVRSIALLVPHITILHMFRDTTVLYLLGICGKTDEEILHNYGTNICTVAPLVDLLRTAKSFFLRQIDTINLCNGPLGH